MMWIQGLIKNQYASCVFPGFSGKTKFSFLFSAIVITFFVFSFSGRLVAQQNCVFSVSKETVLVGEPFELFFSVRIPETNTNDSISFSSITKAPNSLYVKDSLDFEPFADLELLNSNWKNVKLVERVLIKNVPVTKKENGFLVYEANLKVAIYNPGIFTMTYPLVNNYPCQQNKSVSVEVIVPAPDSIQQIARDTLYPIKPIIKEPVKWTDYLFIVYIILGLIALYFLNKYLKKKKTEEAPADIPPSVSKTPQEIAFEKLAALRQSDLWNPDDGKEFLAQLSLIFREFLENEFVFPAKEMTSPEITQKLHEIFPGKSALTQQINRLLYLSDMVKFAKAKTNTLTPDDLIQEVKQCILDTKNDEK